MNPYDEFLFEIGPFIFKIGKYYDWGPKSRYYYFSGVEHCLDIDEEKGFTTPATAQQYAMKKVKQLHKKLEEVV